MTTPAQMLADATATIKFLETKLPTGSHVVLMGLADGRYGALFSTEIYTRGCHWFPRLLA
jgi:hypothetical protein